MYHVIVGADVREMSADEICVLFAERVAAGEVDSMRSALFSAGSLHTNDMALWLDACGFITLTDSSVRSAGAR